MRVVATSAGWTTPVESAQPNARGDSRSKEGKRRKYAMSKQGARDGITLGFPFSFFWGFFFGVIEQPKKKKEQERE